MRSFDDQVATYGELKVDEGGRVAASLACAACGYDLRTLPADGACVECGAPIRDTVQRHGRWWRGRQRSGQRLRAVLRLLAVRLLAAILLMPWVLAYLWWPPG